MPYFLFLEKRQNLNCRLLQIIGGALRVKRNIQGLTEVYCIHPEMEKFISLHKVNMVYF